MFPLYTVQRRSLPSSTHRHHPSLLTYPLTTPVLTPKVIFFKLNFPALLRPPISTKTGWDDGMASCLWGSWILQTAPVAAAADGVEVGTTMSPCLGSSGGKTMSLHRGSSCSRRLCCPSSRRADNGPCMHDSSGLPPPALDLHDNPLCSPLICGKEAQLWHMLSPPSPPSTS